MTDSPLQEVQSQIWEHDPPSVDNTTLGGKGDMRVPLIPSQGALSHTGISTHSRYLHVSSRALVLFNTY